MEIKKSLIMSMSLALCSLSVLAATPGVTFLFSNGQKASFAFSVKPEIAVSSDGLTISSADAASATYTFADVDRFYFEDDINTGISQVESAVSSKHPVFSYVNGVVTVGGMSANERLVVSTVSGSIVSSANANNEGSANADISAEPASVYIISTASGINFKLLKK